MNVLVALLAVLPFAYGAVQPQQSPVYGYLTRVAIPEAERIRKAEEAFIENKDSRIVGGVPAALGQYPYQAGIISDIIGITGRGVCGGSLISANRVVTAAHCWFDGQNQAWRFTVVLGSIRLFTGGTRVQTSVVRAHPLWIPILPRNDIAVVYLAQSLQFTGQNITQSQSLNHVRLNIISNQVCGLLYPFVIQDSHLCTNSLGGTSTCGGDSGGPLVLERAGQRILIGVTSFGSTLGCQAGIPASFTRVTSFLDFINENL